MYAFTAPNLQVLSHSFKKIQEFGIYKYWMDYAEQRVTRQDKGYSKEFPSAYSPYWTEFVADASAGRERERISSFENSLLKSAFYLYGTGIEIAASAFLGEFVLVAVGLMSSYMIHYFYKFLDNFHG